MNTQPLQDFLANSMDRMMRWSFFTFSKSLAEGGATFTQYCLLGLLDNELRSPTMTEVARQMKHTMAASTGLVDRLVQLGYVRRVTDQADRRRVLVEITDEGRALLRRVQSEHGSCVQRFMQLIQDDELETCLKICKKLNGSDLPTPA